MIQGIESTQSYCQGHTAKVTLSKHYALLIITTHGVALGLGHAPFFLCSFFFSYNDTLTLQALAEPHFLILMTIRR